MANRIVASTPALPTYERARELFDLDVETGILTWRIERRCGTNGKGRVMAAAGTVAGSRHNSGYRQIKIDGRVLLVHRVVWLLAYGEWPIAQVDHENGDKLDNRPKNLRAASVAENAQNQRLAHATNKSTGILGVSFVKPRPGRGDKPHWEAHIRINGKVRRKRFSSIEAAQEQYLAWKREVHPFGML